MVREGLPFPDHLLTFSRREGGFKKKYEKILLIILNLR